jgi:hypothetical protein
MRIAYVSLHWPRTSDDGVGKKIMRQIEAWRAAGHEVTLYTHMHAYSGSGALLPAERFLYNETHGLTGRFTTEISRSRALQKLLACVATYRPDLIYLRWGIYAFPLERLCKIAPVVMEINTNDVAQHRFLGKAIDAYNRLTRGIILRRVSGLVTISAELGRLPEFASYQRPTRAIGNGYNLANILPLPAPHNNRPHLAFLGSPRNPWHGIDKLVALACAFPDLIIDVIGYEDLPGVGPLPDNLVFHGYLKASAYLQVLATADASMGSLALHRTGMLEGSPLKTYECLAYGLPMVLAYRDTNLDDLDCDFLLKLPNNEDNIQSHAREIYDFAVRMRGRRADLNLVGPRIDDRLKEKERLEFFQEILAMPHR